MAANAVVGKASARSLGEADATLATEGAAAAAGIPGMGGDDGTVSDTEADEMEEHLRGLGYLE